MVGGPNSPISNGSLIGGLETAIDYAYRCITKMQTENIQSMDVKVEAMVDFLEHRNSFMELMVWSDKCKSWSDSLKISVAFLCVALTRPRYKNGKEDGPVIGPWVGSSWHYEETLHEPRYEDYNMRYLIPNRFAYLGYGRTKGEVNGADMSASITEPGLLDVRLRGR